MGKRHSTYTGLSHFVLEAFKNGDDASQSQEIAKPPLNVQTVDAGTSLNSARKVSARRVEQDEPGPSKKKRKVGLLGPGYESYDATGLVPYYTDASEVPDHLRKYFFQRERYFSLYSEGCLLDEEGWYSVTPELIASQIAERCRCTTILDAFCGVGGNAIAFAQTCERVIALDTSPTRLALARHNAVIYGVEDRIEFILADYLSFARSMLSLQSSKVDNPNSAHRNIDVVFLSPPWGGPEYLSGTSTDKRPDSVPSDQHPEFNLSSIQPIHGAELFKLSRRITKNIAYFLPRNTNLAEISALLPEEENEKVEVEEEWMGSKLKALTCYFGGLADGQEGLFDE